MDDEACRVGEDRAQHASRRARFDRAMEMRDQIRRREMHAPVRCVGRSADRRRIRRPHRRRGRTRGQQPWRSSARQPRMTSASVPANPSARNAGYVGPLVRRQHGLAVAAVRPASASSPTPGAPLRADWRQAARCARQPGCRAPVPHSCASARGCRRSSIHAATRRPPKIKAGRRCPPPRRRMQASCPAWQGGNGSVGRARRTLHRRL